MNSDEKQKIEKPMKTNETWQKPLKTKKNKKNNGFRKDQGGTDIFPKSISFFVF